MYNMRQIIHPRTSQNNAHLIDLILAQSNKKNQAVHGFTMKKNNFPKHFLKETRDEKIK